jgi:hypothetical protein
MLQNARKWLWLVGALLVLSPILGGCLSRVDATPDRLSFGLPATFTVDRGTTLLDTGIVYESSGADGIYMLIDGQRALKRKGDSIRWAGSPVAGTEVDLDLRIVWYTDEQMHLVGRASIVVLDVEPQVGLMDTDCELSFTGPIAYGIALGSHLPGTTLTYVGETEQGAELGGLYNEYPYRQIGDSIIWEGRLREGVYMRVELRTVQFGGSGLRVAGVATLWFDS